MWMLDVIKIGVGVIEVYSFRNRAEAVAKRTEIESANDELYCLLQWEN